MPTLARPHRQLARSIGAAIVGATSYAFSLNHYYHDPQTRFATTALGTIAGTQIGPLAVKVSVSLSERLIQDPDHENTINNPFALSAKLFSSIAYLLLSAKFACKRSPRANSCNSMNLEYLTCAMTFTCLLAAVLSTDRHNLLNAPLKLLLLYLVSLLYLAYHCFLTTTLFIFENNLQCAA